MPSDLPDPLSSQIPYGRLHFYFLSAGDLNSRPSTSLQKQLPDAPSSRWDEKAGLPRDALSSRINPRTQRCNRKETGNEEA